MIILKSKMCSHTVPQAVFIWTHFSPWDTSGLTTIWNWFEFDTETELGDDKDVVNMDEDEDEDDDEDDDADEDEDEGDDDDDDETSSLPTELSLTDSKDDLLTKAAMLSPFAWPPRSKSSPSSSSSSTCRFLFFLRKQYKRI